MGSRARAGGLSAALLLLLAAAALVSPALAIAPSNVPWVAGDIAVAAGAIGSSAPSIVVLRPSDLAIKDFKTLNGLCTNVGGLRFSLDGTKLYVACRPGKVLVIDALANTHPVLSTFSTCTSDVQDLEFGVDGHLYTTAAGASQGFCVYSPTNQLLQSGFAGAVVTTYVSLRCNATTPQQQQLIFTNGSRAFTAPLPGGTPVADFGAGPQDFAGGVLALLNGNAVIANDFVYNEVPPGGGSVAKFGPFGPNAPEASTNQPLIASPSLDPTGQTVYVAATFSVEGGATLGAVYQLDVQSRLALVKKSDFYNFNPQGVAVSNATRALFCGAKPAPPGVPCTAGPCCNATTKTLVSNGTACVWDVPSGSGVNSLFALPAGSSSGERRSCGKRSWSSSSLAACGGTCQSGVCVLTPPAGSDVASTHKKKKNKKNKNKGCCELPLSSGGFLRTSRRKHHKKDRDDDDDNNQGGCFCLAKKTKWG